MSVLHVVGAWGAGVGRVAGSGGGAAAVADEELPEYVEGSLKAGHALFEPAHAVKKIPDFGVHAFAEVPDLGMYVFAEVLGLGMHVVAEVPGLGMHVVAEVPDLGIHMAPEIRDVATQSLMSCRLARCR